MYDLLPLLKTSNNIPLKLTEESANLLSPMYQTIKVGTDVKFYVITAENESPMFIQQAKLFHEKLKDSGVCSEFILVPHTDHFNVVENLVDEDYAITKLITRG